MNTVADLPLFHGSDYDPRRDAERLTGQRWRVFAVYRDGRWRSTQKAAVEVCSRFGTRDKESSVARQMRYLRDLDGWTLEKRHVEGGLFEYRLVPTKTR